MKTQSPRKTSDVIQFMSKNLRTRGVEDTNPFQVQGKEKME